MPIAKKLITDPKNKFFTWILAKVLWPPRESVVKAKRNSSPLNIFSLDNGLMSTNSKGETEIRQKTVENDLVDCMIALPGQLFYTTQIPVCLWFLTKDKKADSGVNNACVACNREGEPLFIDASSVRHHELNKATITTNLGAKSIIGTHKLTCPLRRSSRSWSSSKRTRRIRTMSNGERILKIRSALSSTLCKSILEK